jgi:hypothetical protein
MRVKQNSVTVEEQLEDGLPYMLWDADLYECVECGDQVISGFGQGPIAEHWQPTYADQRARLEPIYPGRCRPDPTKPQAVDMRLTMSQMMALSDILAHYLTVPGHIEVCIDIVNNNVETRVEDLLQRLLDAQMGGTS